MCWPAFEAFADEAVSHIRDEARQSEVREELLDHMESKAEPLLLAGYSQEDAAAAVLRDMGEAEPLAGQLGAVNSRVPAEDMHSAMNKVFWGLLLSLFSLDFWYLKLITTSIGAVLFFAGLYQLRRTNPSLKKAFWLYTFHVLFSAGITAYTALPAAADMGATLWLTVIGTGLQLVGICYLGSGLSDLCERSGGEEGEAPRINSIGGWYFFSLIFAVLGMAGFGFFAVIPAFIVFGYILRQISRTREYLYFQGVSAGTKELGRRGMGLSYLMLALLLVLPFGVSWFVATETPPAAVFDPAAGTAPADKERVAELRAKLLDLGLDETFLNDLPDAEVRLLEDTETVQMIYCYQTVDGGELAIAFAACRRENVDGPTLRLITRAWWEIPPEQAYRDGLALQWADALFWEPEESSAWTLFERDGSIWEMPVLSEREQSWTVPAVEFRVVPKAQNLRVLQVANFYEAEYWGYQGCYYIHRTSPFALPFYSSAAPMQSSTGFFMQTEPLPSGFQQIYAYGLLDLEP